VLKLRNLEGPTQNMTVKTEEIMNTNSEALSPQVTTPFEQERAGYVKTESSSTTRASNSNAQYFYAHIHSK
jgi:hypothetical protein